MPERYFEKFQLINYANTIAVNLTQRSVVLNSVYSSPNLYYLYNIKPYERADTVADEYYQDQYMSWILYLTNKMVDPYYDWNLDQNTFDAFIVKKYGSYDNSVSKVKYFRNNWYTQPDVISVSQYNTIVSANGSLARYYAPTYLDDTKNTVPNGYVRKREDWQYNTNRVASYAVANGSAFVSDEIVNVTFDANNTGRGQVSFSNSSTVILQHLFDTTTTGTITGSSYLYGRQSKANTVFTAVTSLANNIPSSETTYWDAVTYFQYELEINERNKSIQVLDKRYSTQISRELKRLMK
jgi:hypothetical protein